MFTRCLQQGIVNYHSEILWEVGISLISEVWFMFDKMVTKYRETEFQLGFSLIC